MRAHQIRRPAPVDNRNEAAGGAIFLTVVAAVEGRPVMMSLVRRDIEGGGKPITRCSRAG